jgi:hypothetical protein
MTHPRNIIPAHRLRAAEAAAPGKKRRPKKLAPPASGKPLALVDQLQAPKP